MERGSWRSSSVTPQIALWTRSVAVRTGCGSSRSSSRREAGNVGRVVEPEQDRRVDELRQQLRALGYLDAGVNRFVLGPAQDRRAPLIIALLASARVGVLAALLLGPAAAIGLNGRLPGLVTGPRDAFVVAVYLGLLFGAGVALVSFIASVAVSAIAAGRLAARAQSFSRAAGATIAISCLAYLTLWWRSANAGFGWTAPVWTGFALAVAVTISLLLGHLVTAAAFAVIVANRGGDAAANPLRTSAVAPALSHTRSTWRMTVVAALAAFAGAAALLMVTAPKERTGGVRVPLAVVPSGLRVRLVAIDGVDPGVLDELARTGHVPTLGAALARARVDLDLQDAGTTRDPARSWTTIATGRAPYEHGVRGLETRRVAGLQGTVASRRAVAAHAGHRHGHRSGPTHPAGDRERQRTARQNDLGSRLRRGPAHGRRQLVGDVAGAGQRERHRAERPRHAAARTRRRARRGDRAGIVVRVAACTMAGSADQCVRSGACRGGGPGMGSGRHARARSSVPPTWTRSNSRSRSTFRSLCPIFRRLSARAGHRTEHLARRSKLRTCADGHRGAAAGAARLLRVASTDCSRPCSAGARRRTRSSSIAEPGRVAAAARGLMGVSGRAAANQKALAGNVDRRGADSAARPGVPVSRELAGTPLTALFSDRFRAAISGQAGRHIRRPLDGNR